MRRAQLTGVNGLGFYASQHWPLSQHVLGLPAGCQDLCVFGLTPRLATTKLTCTWQTQPLIIQLR